MLLRNKLHVPKAWDYQTEIQFNINQEQIVKLPITTPLETRVSPIEEHHNWQLGLVEATLARINLWIREALEWWWILPKLQSINWPPLKIWRAVSNPKDLCPLVLGTAHWVHLESHRHYIVKQPRILIQLNNLFKKTFSILQLNTHHWVLDTKNHNVKFLKKVMVLNL